MKGEKRMDKKILVSMMVIGLVATLAGAGLYAYFSDTETSSGNKFTAGTLDLMVNGQNPWTTPITVSNLAPGDSGSRSIVIKNVGSIDGCVNLELGTATNTEGLNPESETEKTEPGDLGDYLVVTIYFDEDGDLGTVNDQTFVCSGIINTIGGHLYNAYHPLCAGDLSYLVIVYNLPGHTGNNVQGDIVSFDISVILEQATIVKSNILHYSPTGWGGWSDKDASKHGYVRNCIVKGGSYAKKVWWGPEASTDGVKYPNTPFGYTYDNSIPETGYIVQNDGVGKDLQLILVYPP
jgi:predicted ribosomally synthesized peptide with SipW-like signal peptide